MSSEIRENVGVYQLITELCYKTASKCSQSKVSQKHLASKMRSHAYEIVLRKSRTEIPSTSKDPIIDLLSHQFVLQNNVKNVAEYKKSVELKKAISQLRQMDFGDSKDTVYSTLRLLIGLRDSVREDLSETMFQNPFSFGLLDEMLPKPNKQPFGSPQPYPYYPSYVFELPYSLRAHGTSLDSQVSQSHTEYTVESYDSRSFLPDSYSNIGAIETKTFLSPMLLASMTSTAAAPYSETTILNYPRLTAPRDLQIPSLQSDAMNVKVSLPSVSTKSDIKEVFRASNKDSVDIWELAALVDKDVSLDIWELASKLPPTNERQLIAASPRELTLWRRLYDGAPDLCVLSEAQFIRHVMYLIIGVETSSFPFSVESNSFYLKEGLVLEGVSKGGLAGYVEGLLAVGTYYRRLYNFAFNHSLEDHADSKGLIYEAVREEVRKYLLKFRLKATEVFEDCFNGEGSRMPTLLQILFHMEPLRDEIETVASVYRLMDTDVGNPLPRGAELMSCLFADISLVTHRGAARALYRALFAVCKVYFKLIERFIFSGSLRGAHGELFVRADAAHARAHAARYWERAYRLAPRAVPAPLRPAAPLALLCGKSLRLLQLCDPNEAVSAVCERSPPAVRCCGDWAALARAARELRLYRTRCRYVRGEASLRSALVARRAERAARAERATLKQAETMDKIQAERKRLAQLLVAEKQHSLRVLEAAIEEARAARGQARRERARGADEPDSRLHDHERNKMMEYYSKLNMEVEKNKIHTEWKIKRLQLDQSRMQLLSTEERNLKREKLELEHQRNEAVMQMSIQSTKSDFDIFDDDSNDNADNADNANNGNIDNDSALINNNNGNNNNNTPLIEPAMTDATPLMDLKEVPQKSEVVNNKAKAESSSDVFSAICNVAKSIFGVSKPKEKNKCDNEVIIDSEGNVVTPDSESNTNKAKYTTSNEVIGANLNEACDNQRYMEMRIEALTNKEKVMSHEFDQTDNDNNQIKEAPLIKLPSVDEENNEEDWTPHAEARRNKKKVLGAEFGVSEERIKTVQIEPRTEAQREALVNKQKVLGVEYNLPLEAAAKRDAVNVAQEEAVRNKKKVLGSEYETGTKSDTSAMTNRKSSLTLNLKPYGETSGNNLGIASSSGALTPGELFTGLDLETPTTGDILTDGPMTGDALSPRSETSKDLESAKVKPDKDFLTSDGFNFSLIVDEGSDVQTATPDISPSKTIDMLDTRGQDMSVLNMLDGTYKLNSFDPFGVKDFEGFSKDYFNSKMDVKSSSVYTHPATIMEEVKKKPYSNIFSHYDLEDEEEDEIGCDNIATLTACLQRSVMLPLTYQLEVVNDSILNYFLVNLDLYEHLRCLKDYFFLMDAEFSRSICNNLFSKLTKTVNPQELLNFATLHNILDKALASSISHVPKFSERLSFSLLECPLSFAHSSPDVLAPLALSYAVHWPLNMVLSQEALLRYAKVFQFRLKIRRVVWVLAEDYESLRLATKLAGKRSRLLVRSPQFRAVSARRHGMAALARALDAYVARACVRGAWARLGDALMRARTLDELRDAHAAYLKQLLFRCLLNNRSTPVMKLLNDIFTVILKFSRVLKSGEWEQSSPDGWFTHPRYAQLEELAQLSGAAARYLRKVVARLASCGYQRALLELLDMLQLNGYYDQPND